MRTHYRVALALAVGVVVALLTGCGDGRRSVTDPSPVGATRGVSGGPILTTQSAEDVPGDHGQATGADDTLSAERANTTAVCHIEGNGTFHLIYINVHALQAHLNHGDVLPQDGVCPEPITTTAGR